LIIRVSALFLKRSSPFSLREGKVEIRDTGAGIPEEDRPYIFDPFFGSKAVGVGMGCAG